MSGKRYFTNYAIIGMGAAGVSAALAIRQSDKTGSISLITSEPDYYSRPGLAYVLAGEIPENQLFPFPRQYFKDQKIHIINHSVQAIDLENQKLLLHQSLELTYDKLLIATGAMAVKPNVPGIDLEGVVKLDNLSDARQILKYSRHARTAVVIGGGITAIELVEGLAAQGVETHYFLRGKRYWSSVLDEVESRIVERRLIDDGIRIHYQTDLLKIIGRRGRVTGVNALQAGKETTLPSQIVAVAIGIKPRIRLAMESGLQTQRGILVDPQLRASTPNVFAAGDVAQVYTPEKGEYLLDSLWNPAKDMGEIAGKNMAGANLIYEKKNPMNVTRLAGLVTTIIGRVGRNENENGNRPSGDADVAGIMRGDSEVWRLHPNAMVAQTYSGDNRLRLYINGSKLVGAVVMGDQTLSHAIQDFIHQEVDIRPIREALLTEGADLHQILANYWSMQSHAAKIA